MVRDAAGVSSRGLRFAAHLDARPRRADPLDMLHLGMLVLVVLLVVALAALARAITNWFADR